MAGTVEAVARIIRKQSHRAAPGMAPVFGPPTPGAPGTPWAAPPTRPSQRIVPGVASLALHRLLREPLQPGRVIAVLPSVIYLDFGEHDGEPQVIALTTPGSICLPNAIALKLPSRDTLKAQRTEDQGEGLMAGCGSALTLSVS